MTQTKQSAKRRHELFCRAYLIDFNASKAAIAAGYSETGKSVTGVRLLANPKIQARIQELVAEKTRKLDMDADATLEHIAKLARANMLDYVVISVDGQPDTNFSKLTRDQGYAIQEITVDATGGTGDGERRQVMRTRFKLAGKEKPLEMLAKYHKLLTDVVKHEGLEGLAELVRQRRKAVVA